MFAVHVQVVRPLRSCFPAFHLYFNHAHTRGGPLRPSRHRHRSRHQSRISHPLFCPPRLLRASLRPCCQPPVSLLSRRQCLCRLSYRTERHTPLRLQLPLRGRLPVASHAPRRRCCQQLVLQHCQCPMGTRHRRLHTGITQGQYHRHHLQAAVRCVSFVARPADVFRLLITFSFEVPCSLG